MRKNTALFFTLFHPHSIATDPMSAAAASSLVDGDGALNMRKLQQELHHALDEDHRLTRVDAVKKRAVRTVGSYEEFKNLVACAHLRPLSRKDIQSVAQRTQGWTTTSSAGGRIKKGGEGGGSNVSSGPLQTNVKKMGARKPMTGIYNRSSSSSSPSSSSSTTTATTPLAFEREWQQLVKSGKSSQEKLSLLRSVGGVSYLRRCYIMGKKKREMNADVLGDLLVVLREELQAAKGEGEREEKEHPDRVEQEGMSADVNMNVLKLLHALTQIDRFQITLALLSRSQLEAAREMVEKLESEGRVEEEGEMHHLEEVRRTFSFTAGGGGREVEEAR